MKKVISLVLAFSMILSMICSSIIIVNASEGSNNKPAQQKGINLSKTAEGLTEDMLADVNLQVGGDSFMDPVDIIFVLGGGAAKEAATIKEAIKLFESLLIKDIPVRLGIVSLQVMPYTILDLNSKEADLRQYYAAGNLEEFVTNKYNSIYNDYVSGKLHDGTTNLEHALNVAWEMFKNDKTGVKDENKFVFAISTGRTYWFDNEDGKESTVIAMKKDAKNNPRYLWGDYLWRRMRSGGTTSDYVIPKKYNNSFEAYWTDLVNMIGKDGDKYVYTPEKQSDDAWFSTWSSSANNGGDYTYGSRYGKEIDSPVPSGANFATGVVDAVPHQERSDTNIIHALNYERAQYEAWLTYTAMDEYYNMFAICSESAKYQNNSKQNSISHSFMDFLAGGKAPILGADGFFQPIADQIKKTHLLAEGSYVKDYMGYNDGTNGEDPYNFDFVDEANTLALYVGSDKYTATKIETTAGATSTYSFKDGKFILDYYYNGGAEDEHFKWSFNEIVSSDLPVSLDYKVKLVQKPTSVGIHDLDTNRVATLYPVDSEEKEGTPKDFPVPSVKYEVLPIEINVEKIWDDANDQDGLRPDEITINLLADGEVIKSGKLNEANDWNFTFEELPEFVKGQKVVYTIEEVSVDGYATTIAPTDDGFKVTNKYTPATIDIEGEKTWIDNNDQDGLRPDEITINLLADDVVIKSVKVTEADGWAWIFEDLPKYRDGGIEIVYSITEDAVEGYETTVDGFNVINTHIPEETTVEGEKLWNDNNDQDGIRPESIIINLFADGVKIDSVEVKEVNGKWTFEFVELPKYRDGGIEIVYTVEEEAVEGYETDINGNIIVNTHAPEKIDVEGTKTWIDNEDQDGIRPESITINLFKDGTLIQTITVTEENNWSWKFTGLDKYRDGGIEIVYTITEKAVEGYETSIDGFNVTNTHIPATKDIEGTKTWNDNDDQDGIRPDSIIINLLADGKKIDSVEVKEVNGKWTFEFVELPKYRDGGIEIVYTVEEEAVEGYESTINGFNITNTHIPATKDIEGEKTWIDNDDQDGIRPESITINLLADGKVIKTIKVAGPTWNWTFEDLPKYRDGGIEIVYSITEDAVEGYETTVDGFNVINTHKPEETEVTGEKIWNDANNQDGIRPESIIINLFADGKKIDSVEVKEVNGKWTFEFVELPKYRDGGIEIVYTVEEEAVEGYESTVNGTIVTNKHNPETIVIEGEKLWDDNNDQDGIRPENVTINLLADGQIIRTFFVTAADGWTWKIENLPKYRDGGIEIVYTITEKAVEGYETSINGFTVTNTHVPATVEVEGEKIWNDANNQDGKRPEEITINLLADNVVVKTIKVTSDNWSWTFENLPKYRDGGIEIVYSISEEKVEGYTTEYEGFNVINSYAPEKTNVEVLKVWNDANDQDGIRPESIIINLLKNGEVFKTATLTAADGWAYNFTDLDKYEAGKVIVYTIAEVEVEGYETVIDGFTVTNTHVPATVVVEGNKTWVDADDQDGIRPESITINLLANGTVIKTITVTEADGWAWTFENLAKYEAGEEIVYSIKEEKVEGYTASYDGFNVTNTHVPATVVVEGNKTWVDADDQDGIRPESIVINLLANGTVIETITVTEADGWAWTFENLAKYEAGVEIVYSITEEAVEGYETTVDGFNVTNTHVPATVVVEGEKIWDDNDDQDGLRPDEITINLLANGKVIKTITVTKAADWKFIFEDLAKFEAGEEIIYTIEEVAVEGYEASYNGYIVTNTHAPETTSVKVEKIWEDEDDADGLRPESITVHLYANGVLVETKVITEADGWAWTFENLAKYSAGEEIVYTISEDEVEEYETSIEGSAEEGFIITNTHEVIVDIFEESTPLAPPATGDKSITALLVMSITSLVIGALVAAKRRREF